MSKFAIGHNWDLHEAPSEPRRSLFGTRAMMAAPSSYT